jgi:predicted acetyltransferase
MTPPSFEFFDPGPLRDGDLELVLVEKSPGRPEEGIVPAYHFQMRRGDPPQEIGYIHLRTSLTPRLREFGGHIGYGVNEPFRGHRYAARACRLLFPLARRHGIDPILVTCDEGNAASRRTCERIGGELQRIAPAETENGVIRRTCYYHVRP